MIVFIECSFLNVNPNPNPDCAAESLCELSTKHLRSPGLNKLPAESSHASLRKPESRASQQTRTSHYNLSPALISPLPPPRPRSPPRSLTGARGHGLQRAPFAQNPIPNPLQPRERRALGRRPGPRHSPRTTRGLSECSRRSRRFCQMDANARGVGGCALGIR